jgi:hypothetical protein
VTCRETGEEEHRAEAHELRGRMVANERRHGEEGSEHDERQRKPSVEAPGLQPRPLVEEADDLPPLVGVRAGLLSRARVADLGPAAVADEASLAVALVRPEVLTFGALPGVETAVVAEARRPITLGTAMRMTRESVQRPRSDEEEERVRAEDEGLRVHLVQGRPSGMPAGSVISVKRASSGCSSVMRGTVWRTPSQQR